MSFIGNAIGSLGSGISSIFGGGSSAGNAANSAIQQAVGTQDANQPYRPQYAYLLNQLISNPNSVTQTPGYQFQMQQGTNAIQGSAAASGTLNSGNTAAALENYGQGLASSQYQQQIQNLTNLSQGNPAYSQEIAQGNLASVAGNQANLGLGVGALSSLFNTFSGSNSSSGGGGLFSGISNLFSGSGSSAAGNAGETIFT